MRSKIILVLIGMLTVIMPSPMVALTTDQVINEYPQISSITQSGDLVTKIQRGIASLILANTHRDYPASFLAEDVNKIMFWKGQEVWSLSEMMPYLDTTSKTNLSNYLKYEVTNYLLSDTYRNFEIQGNLSTKVSGIAGGMNWWQWRSVEYEQLYGLWAYAYYTNDWATIQNNWTKITNYHNSILSKGHKKFIAAGVYARSRNSEVAGRIAYARMARKLFAITGNSTYQTAYQNQISPINTALSALSAQVSNGPFDDQVCDFDGNQVCASSGSGFDGRTRQAHLVEYDFLTPELGRYMKANFLSQTQSVVTNAESLFPYWYLSSYNIVSGAGTGGEGYYQPPAFSYHVFQAKSQILDTSAAALRKQLPWVDEFTTVPWYTNALAYANINSLIRRSETVQWGDTNNPPASPNPSIGPIPSINPSPSPNPADLNNDGIVNTTDLKTLLLNWFAYGASDIITDQKTNALDAAAVIRAMLP